MSAIANVREKTLKTAIHCTGTGLHSGAKVSMTLKPAPAGTGIVFRRTDMPSGVGEIRALWSNVIDTRLCTALGNDHGVRVSTIEHLMAALYGGEIDNAIIEINGPEVPIMDGSAQPFVFLIECAGVVEQDRPRRAIQIVRPVSVAEGKRSVTLMPASDFAVEFEFDFDNGALSAQDFFMAVDPATFRTEVSRARTFGFVEEVARLRAAGLARGGSLENAVVIGNGRVLNKDGLRFQDEFVRHKVLDCVGDLYLAGAPLIGRVRCIRSGHRHNNIALRALFEQRDAWRFVDLPAAQPVERATHADLKVAAAGD
ncbi:MAG TPA: UDP-3-O-acyl-N-acetylglucosamine deacetylase [Alphaproteobacteria bacterium]|nr:UDP-3-O-acyl-N-acetylglucosamine deacetylase [Alphaproteobacteria bacterium]